MFRNQKSEVPLPTEREKASITKAKSETIYWLRFGLAILSALLSILVKANEKSAIVAIIVYLVSYLLARYAIKPVVKLGREVYLKGLGTYFVTWLAFWALLYTFLNPPN